MNDKGLYDIKVIFKEDEDTQSRFIRFLLNHLLEKDLERVELNEE